MPDREKVIEDLEFCVNGHYKVELSLATKILALLKEQDAVVRCKDCEYACICSDDWVICTHIDSNGNDKHPVDWFCADGERRSVK